MAIPAIIGGLLRGIGAKKAARQQRRDLEQAASQFDPIVEEGRQSSRFVSQLLGQSPGTEGREALQRFGELSGIRQDVSRGLGGVTGSLAARGLLGSSGAARAFVQANNELRGNNLNSFLSRILGQQQRGDAALQNRVSILAGRPTTKGRVLQGAADSIGGAVRGFFGG